MLMMMMMMMDGGYGIQESRGTSSTLMRSVIYADHNRPPLSPKDGCGHLVPVIKLLPEVIHTDISDRESSPPSDINDGADASIQRDTWIQMHVIKERAAIGYRVLFRQPNHHHHSPTH